MIDYDEAEAAGLCECGQSLDTHPPLAAPGPLRSWKSERADALDAEKRRAATAHLRHRVQPSVRRRGQGTGLLSWW